MKEQCGIYGIYFKTTGVKTIPLVIHGLRLLQHRGQEGCGICFHDGENLTLNKGIGKVDEVLGSYESSCDIASNKCIGHVRYSTSGSSKYDDKQKYNECQPLLGNCKLGEFYLVHNGNIPNLDEHDTHYIINFIRESKMNNWSQILISLIEKFPCAYCLLIITRNEIFALRDRFGIRPLCIGQNDNAQCVSSESCALQHFELVRDVKPGEIIQIGSKGLETIYQSENSQLRLCAFEYLYFQNPISICEGYLVLSLIHI